MLFILFIHVISHYGWGNKIMNSVTKSYTIAFLAISFFILGLTITSVFAQDTATSTSKIQRAMDPILKRYIRFGRLITEDGLSGDQAYHIAQDRYGFMWVGTADGLNRYDGADVKVYRHDPDDPNSLSHNLVRTVMADQNGDLWIGTWGGGLNQYDSEIDAFIRYQHETDNPHSLSSNIVRTVYEDRAGVIWVGTMGGLEKFDREQGKFTRYHHDPGDSNSLSNNMVWSVFEDSTGVLWVGTDGGLNRFNPKTEQFVHFLHNPDDPSSLIHNAVRSIYEDNSGNLWVGTAEGIGKLNPERTRFTRFQHDANDP
jgi:ligand-binding sensor domain-containing protein